MGLFYFFGIGGTNPASFGLLKSPSGIPPPIMYKKRPDHPARRSAIYCLKMAHHAKNNDKRRR